VRQSYERFVSEPIEPAEDSFSRAGVPAGEPAVPMRFRWRGCEYHVAQILEAWKTTAPDRGGGSERYVRKHWYRIATSEGPVMRIYFERQPRTKGSTRRWWLATISKRIPSA